MFKRVNSDVVPFSINSPAGNRYVFGTADVSNDIDVNYNENIKKGFGTGPNEFPELEDFNALMFTGSYLAAYLYQAGIPEWNDKQKYYINSIAMGSDGNLYKSLTGTEETPNVNNNPTLAGSVSWKSILSEVVKLTENQTIAGVKTFSSSPVVPTPTVDFQSVPLRSTNITVNVGAGQTYTTINQALEYLSGFYPMYKKSGVTATINLKAGFVMAEQVLVSGIDLGWITVVGEDAETIITHTALTTSFNGINYPAFGVDKGGTSPVIGQLFRFNVEKVGGAKHGLMTFGAGSSANVLSGKGFIGAGTYGIFAHAGSTINANGANCSNAGTHGIYAYGGSTINANSANCSNAGAYGIVALDSSTINAQGANCSNAGTHGIYAYGGSTINANSANCSNAGATGIVALDSSTINAQGANCSNAGTHGIYAYGGSTINANSANCSNAGSVGIYAYSGSTIDAILATVQNQTTGTSRIRVQAGSYIEAFGIDTTGGTVPVLSQTLNTLTPQGIIYG